MLEAAGVAELGQDEVLAAAESCAVRIRQAEAELLVLAHQWAVLHPVDRLDPAEAGKPGRERGKWYGGPGTRRSASSRPRSSGPGSAAPPTPPGS